MYTYQILEAAAKHGLNHYAAIAAPNLGEVLDLKTSFPLDREPNYPAWGTLDLIARSGYTIHLEVTLADFDHGTLHLMEIRSPSGEAVHRMTGNTLVSSDQLLQGVTMQLLNGHDTLIGNSADNILQGWTGNDTIDGGPGIDTAAYSGVRSQYTWQRLGDGSIQLSGPEGTDHLVNIERLAFADMRVALDAGGTGGQAYRLYQAAFNRQPDVGGLGFQINALDSGQSLLAVAQNFLDSPEFRTLYGTDLDDLSFVTRLYENVLHRAPDEGGLAYQVGALQGGLSRSQLLVNFSESPENQAALVGTIDAGVVYTV